jgi:hypothetical protein
MNPTNRRERYETVIQRIKICPVLELRERVRTSRCHERAGEEGDADEVRVCHRVIRA